MPTYYAAGISMNLSKHSLSRTKTSNVIRGQRLKGQQKLATACATLSNSERMHEDAIDCLPEQGDTRLKFLGNDPEAPFYCVVVNRRANVGPDDDAQEIDEQDQHDDSSGLSAAPSTPPEVDLMPPTPKLKTLRPSTQAQAPTNELSKDTTPLPARKITKKITLKLDKAPQEPLPPSTPVMSKADQNAASPILETMGRKGLGLTVRLDPTASFCRCRTLEFKDIKIDCFYNGDLSNSVLLPGKLRNETSGSHQVLSGTRVQPEMEAIWLLLPGDPVRRKSHMAATDGFWRQEAQAEHRWSSIARGLRQHVRTIETNEKRKAPPSARYLDHLANMRMPVSVRDMHSIGGLKYGIIDVVITLGQSEKPSERTGNLSRPTHLREDYDAEAQKTAEDDAQSGHVESVEAAEDDGTAAVSAISIADIPPVSSQERPSSAMDIDDDKDFHARAPVPVAFNATSRAVQTTLEKRATPIQMTNTASLLLQARAGEQETTMTVRTPDSSTNKRRTRQTPIEVSSTSRSSSRLALGNDLFSFTASLSLSKPQTPDFPQNPYAPETVGGAFSKPTTPQNPILTVARRTSTLPLLMPPRPGDLKAADPEVVAPVSTVPKVRQTTPPKSAESLIESMSRELARMGKTTVSSDTIIYRPQNPSRRRSSRTKIKPVGRASRIGRKPNYTWDTSGMRQTIALLDTLDALPGAMLPTKRPHKAKLLLRLKIPSLSPAKIDSPIDFTPATALGDEEEEDADFSPSKTRSGKPHNRTASFGRTSSAAPSVGRTATSGRGKNWRRGLRRSNVDPSGWEPSPSASRRASPETSAGASPLVNSIAHVRRGGFRGRGTRSTTSTSDRRGRSSASSSRSPSKASGSRTSMPRRQAQDTTALSQRSIPVLTHATTTPVRSKVMAPPAAQPNAPPTPTPTISRLSTPFPATPASHNSPSQGRAGSPLSLPEFDIPEASEGCIITYAPGMLRQVPPETTDTFKEEEVLLGVRYIVAA